MDLSHLVQAIQTELARLSHLSNAAAPAGPLVSSRALPRHPPSPVWATLQALNCPAETAAQLQQLFDERLDDVFDLAQREVDSVASQLSELPAVGPASSLQYRQAAFDAFFAHQQSAVSRCLADLRQAMLSRWQNHVASEKDEPTEAGWTPDTYARLDAAFEVKQNITRAEQVLIAKTVGLTPTQVRIWVSRARTSLCVTPISVTDDELCSLRISASGEPRSPRRATRVAVSATARARTRCGWCRTGTSRAARTSRTL